MSQKQRGAWAKLHALRMEFHQRINELKNQILATSDPGTVEPAFLHGIDLVRGEFEEYKFKQLAMACFFESSFKRFDGTNGSSVKRSSPLVTDARSEQSLLVQPSQEENTLEGMLRQQRVMSGASEASDEEDGASIPHGENSVGSFEEDLFASVQPRGSSMGPTARDYEFVKSNLPTLSDLSATEENQMDLNQFTEKLHSEGFFDLMHRAGAISDAEFSIYGTSTPLGPDQAYDEEMIFKRNPHSRMSDYKRFSPLKTSADQQQPNVAELKPSVQYTPPKTSHRADDLKYARSIRRTELLGMINKFLSNFGISPVQRRDPLWKDWFLGEYLRLTPDDRSSGHPLVVLDKRDSSSFVEAVRKIYNECCAPTPYRHHQASPTEQEVASSSPSPAKRQRSPGHDQPDEIESHEPHHKAQRADPASMMFPNSGSVFVLRPLLTTPPEGMTVGGN